MTVHLTLLKTSLVAHMVKCLPTIRETRVQFLGQEDLLEKEMATYSSILAWKIPWMEEPGDTTELLHFHLMVGGWSKDGDISFAHWDNQSGKQSISTYKI